MSQAPRRGRPAIVHDNRRVREFLSAFPTLTILREDCPMLEDVLAGVSAAKTEGDTARRSLCRSRLYGLVAGCDFISTRVTAEVLAWMGYCEATVKRYTQAARTVSWFIARELDKAGL